MVEKRNFYIILKPKNFENADFRDFRRKIAGFKNVLLMFFYWPTVLHSLCSLVTIAKVIKASSGEGAGSRGIWWWTPTLPTLGWRMQGIRFSFSPSGPTSRRPSLPLKLLWIFLFRGGNA